MLLERNNISFSESSLMDNFGRVFFYEGKVFRAIFKPQKENCKSFLQSELYKELVIKGYIVQTFETDFELDDFAMIIEHEYSLIPLQINAANKTIISDKTTNHFSVHYRFSWQKEKSV